MAAITWVFVATGVAMLPMRRQFPPGIILLIAAPVIIIWLGLDNGWLISAAAFAAFISMFRNPIRYYWNKWRKTPHDTPKDTP
jgi:nicotinamide riboside transporter PnuC